METICPREGKTPSFAAGQTACLSSKHLTACEQQLLSQPALQHALEVGAASLRETHGSLTKQQLLLRSAPTGHQTVSLR